MQAEKKALNEKRANFQEKPKVVLVANPRNPRGAKVTPEEANRIRKELDAGGLREQDQNSVNQKSNPSIIDSIKKLVSSNPPEPKVVEVNKSFVLLDNGKLVSRENFKGEIPKELSDGTKSKLPANKAFDEDIFGNKIDLTNKSPTVTKKTTATATDPSKTPNRKNSSGRRNDSVNQNDKPETTPIADTAKAVTDAVTNFLNPPEAKADDGKKDEKPLDPLKSLTDFFTNLTKPKETTPTEEPKPKETTTPKPKETTTPTEEPKSTTTEEPKDENKYLKFVKDNGLKILIPSVSAMIAGVFILSTMSNASMIREDRRK